MESGCRAEQEGEQEQQSGADAAHPGPVRYSIARAADLGAPGSAGSGAAAAVAGDRQRRLRLAARRSELSLSLTPQRRRGGGVGGRRVGKALNCRGCSPAGFGGFAGCGCCGWTPITASTPDLESS